MDLVYDLLRPMTTKSTQPQLCQRKLKDRLGLGLVIGVLTWLLTAGFVGAIIKDFGTSEATTQNLIGLYIWVPVAVFSILGIVHRSIKAPTRPSMIMAERNYLKSLLVQATGLYATWEAATSLRG